MVLGGGCNGLPSKGQEIDDKLQSNLVRCRKHFKKMRLILGLIAILLAGLVGFVEFRAIIDPAVAQNIASGFAAHDPFPRLPWDYHVIFVLVFFALLASGLHLIFKRNVGDTRRT